MVGDCYECSESEKEMFNDERCRDCEKKRRDEHNRDRFIKLLNDGLARENFRHITFNRSNPEIEAMNPEGWTKAREWPVSSNLYIHGGVGAGKSYLALCVLKKAFMHDMNVAEVNARRFTKTVDRFDEGGGILDKWKKADFLLIDDIDKTDWNASRLTALWDLLDHRLASSADMSDTPIWAREQGRIFGVKRTLITSNLTPKELLTLFRQHSQKDGLSNSSLADATLDRMKPCTNIHLTGNKSNR